MPFFHKIIHLKRTWIAALGWCVLVHGPLWADDTATNAPPENLAAPSMTHGAAQLRPLTGVDSSSSSPDLAASTPSPSAASVNNSTAESSAPSASATAVAANNPATQSPGLTPSTSPMSNPQVQPPGPSQNAALAQSPSLPGAAPQAATPPPDPSAAAGASAAPPSVGEANAWKNSYVNLINLLVNRGVLTKTDSSNLVKQAENDAKQENTARAQATAALNAPAAPPNPDDDTMRVAYVPETVKEQMRDEIKQDVMQQARDEHWAAPDSSPDWVKRYHVVSDIRLRYENESYPSSNDNQGAFHNFNAINTSSTAFDVGSASFAQNPPYYNVDQTRNFFRLRARIGAEVDVGEGFTAGLRIATGNDDSPVSENQTFDSANGQGGDFSKYAIWLDRAYLKYEWGSKLTKGNLTVTAGRFDNPFFGTTMLWADDLAFDGLVAKGKYQVTDTVAPFLTAGAFPVYNTDLNFGTYNAAKFPSENKYLIATQAGAQWKISDDFNFKGAIAYYDFENIEGQISQPCIPQFNTDSENTDGSRPSFAQNGNTYIALRNITPDASNGFGTTNQFQYFGLATPFHDLDLTGQLDYSGFAPINLSLIGEVVRNLAFNSGAISNNGPPLLLGPVNNLNSSGQFAGGNTGYNISIKAGHPALERFLDWNCTATYRYLQSDATVDGFNDSDFGGSLAGTNLQGYILGGNLALTKRVWIGMRFMSAQAIIGPPFQNNLFMFDVNAKF